MAIPLPPAVVLRRVSFSLCVTSYEEPFVDQKEPARKKGKPKVSSSETTTPRRRAKKRTTAEDRNVVEMTDIQWDQTVPDEDAKTNQPTSDDAATKQPNSEDSFVKRQPQYKDAKAADKVGQGDLQSIEFRMFQVRKQGKVPRNSPGYSTMEETGFTSNFTTDQATVPAGASPATKYY